MLALVRDWTVLFATYLLFVGQLSVAEIFAGAVLAAAAAGFVRAWRRRWETRFLLRAVPWPRVAARVAAALAIDSLRIAGALGRAIAGRRLAGAMTRQPFRASGTAPADAGRRAVAVLAASIAPNGYVAALQDEGRTMLVHRLVPSAPNPDRAWPV